MLSSDSDITNLKEFVKAKSLNNQKGFTTWLQYKHFYLLLQKLSTWSRELKWGSV